MEQFWKKNVSTRTVKIILNIIVFCLITGEICLIYNFINPSDFFFPKEWVYEFIELSPALFLLLIALIIFSFHLIIINIVIIIINIDEKEE